MADLVMETSCLRLDLAVADPRNSNVGWVVGSGFVVYDGNV